MEETTAQEEVHQLPPVDFIGLSCQSCRNSTALLRGHPETPKRTR